ncbi:MAG: DUF4254 domain-containing protein [Hydrococcus sp. RM1_1_31]|nr:DUF4254 domain-containing protein [Hydrococcus sp. RM1_1_31]
MAETLGSLVDKLAIVNLKLWHCQEKLFNLASNLTASEEEKLRLKMNRFSDSESD